MKYSVFVVFLLFSIMIENKTLIAGGCCSTEEDPERKPLVKGEVRKSPVKRKKYPERFDAPSPTSSTATASPGKSTANTTSPPPPAVVVMGENDEPEDATFTRVNLEESDGAEPAEIEVYFFPKGLLPKSAIVVREGENRIVQVPKLCFCYLYPDQESAEAKHPKVMQSLNKAGAVPDNWDVAEEKLGVIYDDIKLLGEKSGLVDEASELVEHLKRAVALLPRETVPIRIARNPGNQISRVLLEGGEKRMLVAVPEPMKKE